MTLQAILVVMLYSVQPYLWLLVLLLLALGLTWGLGWSRRWTRNGAVGRLLLLLALAIGLVAALLAPALTGSRLAYVATAADWVALIGVGIGAALYGYLLLFPLLRQR